MNDHPGRALCRNAAVLITLALLTGILLAQAMVGKLDADAHTVLAAHLGGLMAGFWMLGAAFTFPMLRYGPAGLRRLTWTLSLVGYANWLVTLVKSFFRVTGVDPNGHTANDVVFGVLTVTVVLPALGFCAAWIYGFLAPPPKPAPTLN